MEEFDKFNVIIFGIIFDPKEKKILIGRREIEKANVTSIFILLNVALITSIITLVFL